MVTNRGVPTPGVIIQYSNPPNTPSSVTAASPLRKSGSFDDAPDPFFKRRFVSSKASYDDLADIASDPLFGRLREWIGAFHHPVENVHEVVRKIRTNPLIPQSVPVHGLIFDPNAGKLTLLTEGYAAAGRTPDASEA